MTQTSEIWEPRSMWYSSPPRIKASGLTTLRMTFFDIVPVLVDTCGEQAKLKDRWEKPDIIEARDIFTRSRGNSNFNFEIKHCFENWYTYINLDIWIWDDKKHLFNFWWCFHYLEYLTYSFYIRTRKLKYRAFLTGSPWQAL